MSYRLKLKQRLYWRKRERTPVRKNYRKQWQRNNRLIALRKYYLKALYGLTLDQYTRMLAEHGGGCAICSKKPKPGKMLNVDHNHLTQQVRGLLCSGCNNGLGLFGDTTGGLRKAIQYLECYDRSQ